LFCETVDCLVLLYQNHSYQVQITKIETATGDFKLSGDTTIVGVQAWKKGRKT